MTPIELGCVSRISFDHAVTLLLENGGEIRIETAFELVDEFRASALVDLKKIGNSSLTILSVLHHPLIEATVVDDGTLELRFGNGVRMTVSPDDLFESWSYSHPSGTKIVGLPGGGICRWPSPKPERD